METEYRKHRIVNLLSIQKIVTLHYFEFDRHFHSKGESHDFWELVYADKGDLEVTAGEKTFTLAPGECCFHKPNEFHRHSANGIVAPNIFILSFVCHSQSMQAFCHKQIRVPTILRTHISNMIDEGKQTFDLPFNDPELKQLQLRQDCIPGGQQMIRTYLEQFLILLLRQIQMPPKPQSFPSKESMAEHVANSMLKKLEDSVYQKFSVARFCEEMQYSTAYLSKIFMQNYGCSIGTYMTRLKIGEAKKLIREHTYNFTQIADMLGYTDPFYFSRVFRRVTGMSPTEYKNSVRID